MGMTRITAFGLLAAGIAVGQVPTAASAASLKVTVGSVKSGKMIPKKYAFCIPAAQDHTTGGPNISPAISWSKGPRGTQSYAVILYDDGSPKENRD